MTADGLTDDWGSTPREIAARAMTSVVVVGSAGSWFLRLTVAMSFPGTPTRTQIQRPLGASGSKDFSGWESNWRIRGRENGLDPFYPIVDSAAWVARLVGVGARLIQLRIKDADEGRIARETREALALCRKAGATLIVNDDWRVAIAEGADWVHLGQEDLDTADLAAIRRAGLKLGVSTYDEAELERGARGRSRLCRARADLPDHLQGHGVRGRRGSTDWRSGSGGSAPLPLCAIGGIDLERAKLCLAAGADLVSVISDITLNADPEARAKQWIAATRPK